MPRDEKKFSTHAPLRWSPIKYHCRCAGGVLYVLKRAAGGWQFSTHGSPSKGPRHLRYQSEIFHSKAVAQAAANVHADKHRHTRR